MPDLVFTLHDLVSDPGTGALVMISAGWYLKAQLLGLRIMIIAAYTRDVVSGECEMWNEFCVLSVAMVFKAHLGCIMVL